MRTGRASLGRAPRCESNKQQKTTVHVLHGRGVAGLLLGRAAVIPLPMYCRPDCQQIWTRNLSNGDVAVTFVNYTQTLSSEPNLQGRQSFHTGAGGSSGGSHMALVTCDASQLDQLWQLGATTTSVCIAFPAAYLLCMLIYHSYTATALRLYNLYTCAHGLSSGEELSTTCLCVSREG